MVICRQNMKVNALKRKVEHSRGTFISELGVISLSSGLNLLEHPVL